MTAKFMKFAMLSTALAIFMFVTDHARAATSACGKAGLQCVPGAGAPVANDGRIRVAQVPSVSNTRKKVVIKQPKADIPRKAFKVLDKHCARCHQEGRLERDRPAKSFGNILKLDEIARDPHLIQPGNPDGSRLFSRIVKQEMPYDVYTEFSGGREPSKEDVQALYDWIESLDAKTVASCTNRKPVDTNQIVSAISTNLNKQAAGRRKGMRYLTLTNFYNACAKNDEIRRMRNGAAMLLNSLSRAPRTTRVTAIGTAGSIIAFNLDDLGWSAQDWDMLTAAYPYGVKPRSQAFNQVTQRTKAPLPYLRADWFAAAASRPPFYYKLLDLPEDLEDLQRELGVDAAQNVADGNVMRAGVAKSVVSRYNRVIERHAVGTGYLWKTFDFDGTDTNQTVKERPLGPGGDKAFEHNMNAVIFSLPNGMNAFFLGDGDGKRIDIAPAEILHDDTSPRRPVIAGSSCVSCHASGVSDVVDEVRAHVESSFDFSAGDRGRVLEIYVAQNSLDRQIRDDRKRYANAAAKAGIKLERGDDGLDDLSYLVGKYNRHLDLRVAAAEYGVTDTRYASGLQKGDEEAKNTKLQLEQGTLARGQIEPLFLKHVLLVSGDVPVGQVKAPDTAPAKPALATAKKALKKVKPKPKPKPKKAKPAKETKVAVAKPAKTAATEDDGSIMLVSDKVRYRARDLPVFTVNVSSDCHLTLINVGPAGRATVIFPNKYQQENLIEAGKDFQFPGPDAPFQFRLKDIGKEKLIAECTTLADGKRIQHSFEQEEFTDLGDYRDHVGEQAEKEGEKKSAGATAGKLLRTAITFTVK